MLHTAKLRRPRVLLGQGSGLSKCTKCGVAFVAKYPAQQTCSKCTEPRRQRAEGYAPSGRTGRLAKTYGRI
jgi:uncharacterized OB-fold protein